MNFSSWNSVRKPGKRNPVLSPAHITVEFERTKQIKIFAHKLGSVTFSRSTDTNIERQKVIDRELGNISIDGFAFKNVGHVYSEDIVIPESEEYSYKVLAHGHPLGGTERGGMESCSRSGLKCYDGEGTDSLCNPGRCVIGTLEKINNSKWKYVSSNTYGPDNIPLIYYLPDSESVKLRNALRGSYITYSSDGSPVEIDITNPASVASTILLPPKLYFSDDFLDSLILKTDERLNDVLDKPSSDLIGAENRKEDFIRRVIVLSYPGASEAFLNQKLNDTVTEEVKNTLLELFSTVQPAWLKECSNIIETEFLARFAKVYSGLDFISVVFDQIKKLFRSIIQLNGSSLSISKFNYDKDLISRPLYSRLPGILEGYRSDPAFTNIETPSQWLTSGTDEFLSKKKDSIASFYSDYLDPDNCDPTLLDWLAQHVGLFGSLWNTEWDRETKRAMIRNAFGWWDQSISVDVPSIGTVSTPKGDALNKFPFTKQEWTDSQNDNLLKIKLDEIASIYVSNGEIISTSESVKIKNFSDETNTVTLSNDSGVKVDKALWNGLIESKGGLLNVIFLCSVLGLKSHNPIELQVVDAERKILRPKTGLRNAEVDSPVLMPYKQDLIQVGRVEDASINNYTNQLVAGISAVTDLEGSKNVFFRVPYYYNRDGRSWDKVSYIALNWMPSNLNVRVQYAYLSADLWSVGDAFFEPDVVIVE